MSRGFGLATGKRVGCSVPVFAACAGDAGDKLDVRIEVIKGPVSADDPNKRFKVDGLSGATITSRGVSQMLRYWMGDDGFGPFLQRFRVRNAQGG